MLEISEQQIAAFYADKQDVPRVTMEQDVISNLEAHLFSLSDDMGDLLNAA